MLNLGNGNWRDIEKHNFSILDLGTGACMKPISRSCAICLSHMTGAFDVFRQQHILPCIRWLSSIHCGRPDRDGYRIEIGRFQFGGLSCRPRSSLPARGNPEG